ncbi:hypothetical protein BRC87_09400 [Halobacteriales archaeon QS_4_66_20]|nr:MAG: hypothetical protein BRC87_09400 [Halobacteriales archaeon QS_4_66_20]
MVMHDSYPTVRGGSPGVGQSMIPTFDPRLHVAFLGGSAVLTGYFAVYAIRNRDSPGATWLAATLAATTLWTATYAAGLVTHDLSIRPLWEYVQWIGSAFLPVCFLLFALEYTGHDRVVTRRNVALLSAVPALAVVLVWTSEFHGLLWLSNEPVVSGGLVTMDAEFGPLFWPILLYLYALVLVGGVLLLRLAVLSDYLYTDQSILLFVGLAVPLVGNVAAIFFETSPPGFDFTPYGFVVWGLALTATVYRNRLFRLVPATRRLGRSTAIQQLEDGVVIVDDERRIVYLNEAAASILDCSPAAVVGDDVDSLLGDLALELGPDTLAEGDGATATDSDVAAVGAEGSVVGDGKGIAEVERGGHCYEVRASTITDRRDRRLGHTLVLHDVTARNRREQRLASQRDELERLNELNSAIRGVNQALVSATSEGEVHRAVCESLADTGLYAAACGADVQTWNGDADRWICAADDDPTEPTPLTTVSLSPDDGEERVALTTDAGPEADVAAWTVVPIVYGRTVYGALGVQSAGEGVSEREREILVEVGELVGHALEAIENEQLLSTESVVEIELESEDENAVLAAASADAGCRLTLDGLVPSVDDDALAFVGVEGAPVERVREALADRGVDARTVREGDDGGLLELTLPERTLLGTLDSTSASVTSASAESGAATYKVELLSNAGVRRLLDRVEAAFPDTALEAKRERTQPAESLVGSLAEHDDQLTDRQQEALEAAYRAGYFAWPRESTAEEIAESFGVSPATLHGHLRKAEQSVFDQLFEDDDERG